MLRIIKSILIRIKNNRNKISFGSDISFNTVMGVGNIINDSTLYNSTISNNCKIIKSSVFSGTIGHDTTIEGSTVFSGDISENVSINANTIISSSSINRFTYFAGNNRVFNTKIGSFCSIAENVTIGHAEHPYFKISTSPLFYKKDNPFKISKFLMEEINEFSKTTIGNDVWIGINSYIKSGIVIGDGCVIGAGSVVTKSVEPYSIVAGVPARVIKKRFNDNLIYKLQKDSWWDFQEEKLLEYFKENWNQLT